MGTEVKPSPLVGTTCKECGANVKRNPLVSTVIPPDVDRCLECALSRTFAHGKPWRTIVVGIKMDDKRFVSKIDGNREAVIRGAARVDDGDLWICYLSNGGVAHVSNDEFRSAFGSAIWGQ